MKFVLLSCICFFLYSSLFAQKNENDILGKWMAADNSVEIDVTNNSGIFKAIVIWFDERLGNGKPMLTRKDTNNPNKALRNRALIGMSVLSGLKYDPKTREWENGTIYDASSGRFWSAKASMINSKSISVRGFWKVTWIGKSLIFNKMS